MTKILVGAVVTFIVLSIMTYDTGISILGFWFYGVGGVLFLYFFSIVCTAGAALIVWIPLWYGVGWVVFEVVGWLIKKLGANPAGDTQQPEAQSAASLTRDQQALLNYIKKARARGMNHERISLVLTSEGWTADEMNWAFNALK